MVDSREVRGKPIRKKGPKITVRAKRNPDLNSDEEEEIYCGGKPDVRRRGGGKLCKQNQGSGEPRSGDESTKRNGSKAVASRYQET